MTIVLPHGTIDGIIGQNSESQPGSLVTQLRLCCQGGDSTLRLCRSLFPAVKITYLINSKILMGHPMGF